MTKQPDLKAGWRVGGVAALLRKFMLHDTASSSVEWVVIAAGATGLGLLLLTQGKDTLSVYSSDVREELQGGEFQTEWARNLPVQMD